MKKLVFGSLLAAGLATAACSNSPGSPSVSFTSPLSAGPANGTSYKFKTQPVTVLITNAARTGSADAVYGIEVASDPAFANKIVTREDITEDNGGTTAVALPSLPASAGNVTYYWRSWAVVDGVSGPKSPTQSFVVQQQIIVSAPSTGEPANDSTVGDSRPQFSVKNAARQGAVGKITYKFQVSRSSDFSSILAEQTVDEQSGGQTFWTPGSDLPDGKLYWRVQARDDANEEASSFTSARGFSVEPFDPRKAIFWDNFPDIPAWPQTAKITSVEFNRDGMIVDFDRRTGPDAWPEVSSSDFGPLQYTLGLCYNISGQWHCSAPIQFWAGRDLGESGPYRDIPNNWYYNPIRWGPMSGHHPEPGELVMVWVGQGNLRGTHGNTRAERSNFQPVRWEQDFIAH
jgi:hypothetical protein